MEFDRERNGSYADRYLGLPEDSSALLHRPVDLVIERAVRNPYFLESLRATRQLIFQAHAA